MSMPQGHLSHCHHTAITLRKLKFTVTRTWTHYYNFCIHNGSPFLCLTMVQSVGCHQSLENGKAYSNHQRACKKYKAAGALCLRQMQLNKATKVERAQALHTQVTTDEEPKGLVIHDEHIQDLNHELMVVGFFSHYLSRLTLRYRKILFLY